MLVFKSENSCCNEQDGCERFLDGFAGKLDRFDESNAETKSEIMDKVFPLLDFERIYNRLQAVVIHTVFAMLHRSSKLEPIDLVTKLSIPYPSWIDCASVAMQNLTQRPYDRQTNKLEHFVWNYSITVDYSLRVPNVVR